MLKNNQVWENKTKIAKLEESYCGDLQAVVFKIKSSGLEFHDVVSSRDEDLENYLKKARMNLTDKVLVVE